MVWLNTDSEVLDEAGRRAFERYIRAGGGWVGVHAAAASEYGWSWYGQLLGAYFLAHPAIQPARVVVEISDHPSTEHLPQSFTAEDEWYSFRTNPRSSVQVLMTLDESSYSVDDLAMGDHPIAWYHQFDGGRAWYTALGHPSARTPTPCSQGTCSGEFAGPPVLLRNTALDSAFLRRPMTGKVALRTPWEFGLELHEDKTRVLRFGRYARERTARLGLRPGTFDFLGFTHICGIDRRNGWFQLIRHTSKKKRQATLRKLSDELRRRRHEPPQDTCNGSVACCAGSTNTLAFPPMKPSSSA